MLESLRSRTYAIVDTETTGMSAQGGGIIEVGVLRVEEGRVVKRFHSLVRPARRISHVIQGITGLTNEELESAPTFETIAHELAGVLEGAVLVAHNARFDYSFLKAEFARAEMPYKAKTLCTVKLSRLLYPGQAHHNLDSVMEAHGLSCAQRHRAMEDAEVLLDFLKAVERKQGAGIVLQAIDRCLQAHTLPAKLNREDLRAIPNRPGVYIFYGEDEEVLYVGKSVSMRTRVLSHFSGDHISGREMRMCGETVRVDYHETSGELSALFLESRLVKEMQPTYNRALRQVKQLALVVGKLNSDGYMSAAVEYRGAIEPGEFDEILATCRTKAQAKGFLRTVAKEHGLCAKLLGLESGPGPCFGRQIELCRGACIGAEVPQAYNKRLAKVFSKYKIKSWPYDGPILVRDQSDDGDGTAYVVDQWCLKEVVHYTDGSAAVYQSEAVFDLDSYKILARFLLDKTKSKGLVSALPQGGLASKFEYEYERVVR